MLGGGAVVIYRASKQRFLRLIDIGTGRIIENISNNSSAASIYAISVLFEDHDYLLDMKKYLMNNSISHDSINVR